jgi:hypothetical protein
MIEVCVYTKLIIGELQIGQSVVVFQRIGWCGDEWWVICA